MEKDDMTRLEQYLFTHGIDEVDAMNQLQDGSCIISDCCVWAKDVAQVNEEDAIRFLSRHYGRPLE